MKKRVEKPRSPRPLVVVTYPLYRCARCQAEGQEHNKRFIHTAEGVHCVCGGTAMRVSDG